MQTKQRLKLIVIHGWGGTYADAIRQIGDLLDFDCYWEDGAFFVPRRSATMIRHLLNVQDPNPHILALQQLTLSRFLACNTAPQETPSSTTNAYTRFSESRLRQDFANFGIPISPATRLKRAAQLQRTAAASLKPIMSVIHELQETWDKDCISQQTEDEARQSIETGSAEAHLNESLLPLLELLREMHETGGDLDTVASAALYAYWFTRKAQEEGKSLKYGRDYAFVFINYHEPLTHLKQYAPAELYAADLPVGAFPDLEKDLQYLFAHDVHTARYEDHHPYLADRETQLKALVKDGTLGFLELSGPLQGTELEPGESKCAADMVYANTVSGKPWDCDGARRLREAAHGEDFVTNRTPLGILLTNLIKGGICKTELAQLLVQSMASDTTQDMLERRGWASLPEQWHNDLQETAETLIENTNRITLKTSGTQIIIALATHAPPGKPRLPTGKAVEFFARRFPEADYIFYCFGASLMVARRLNHDDTALNLGALMPALGTAADGGHSGAAVCRPDANPHYPTRLIGRVRPANFHKFSRYLATRLSASGHSVQSVEDISVASQQKWARGQQNAIVVLLLALTLGTLLALAFPSFRRESVLESNQDFFPQIGVDASTSSEREKTR